MQWNAAHVRLIDPLSGQLLREHLRQQRGRRRIQEQDRSTRTPLSTQQLLRRAEVAGPHIGALCQAMHQNLGEEAVRRILGVLNLTKKYGVASTDEACAMGLETGASNYHFVRRYLERNPQLPLSLRQVDPLIRQLTLSRDLIDNRAQKLKTGESIMNLIKVERALRQLRLSGMAAVLETRLRQAQPKPWPST